MIDTKAVLHIIATLTRMIGEDNMVQEMDAIGWRGVKSHPLAFFRSYLEEFEDDDRQDRAELILADMKNIANNYALDIDGDEIIDMVPR